MPATASIDPYPAENVSETAAPHPEEMKAKFDLTIGNAVSLKGGQRRQAWWQRPCSLP
jgi:hypothetical protein